MYGQCFLNGVTEVLPLATEKKKKKCPICGKEKSIKTGFYKSYSPLYSEDGCVPICTTCVKNGMVNEDGTINQPKFRRMLQRLDKPLYWDTLESSYAQFKREHSFLSEDEIARNGKEIVGLYFKNVMMRQNRGKSFADSEKDGFMHQTSNTSLESKKQIARKYSIGIEEEESENKASRRSGVSAAKSAKPIVFSEPSEPLIYSEKWRGKYTESDIKSLDAYYEGLERDYKIITENHRDYARKIAKASLQMDKAFDEMMSGIEGADKKYENATKIFDTLSKSAKFSESTRSVNDVGISSFSKVASMVEAHNWIPEHKPLKKDTIDELIDYLSTITKSI